MKITVITPVYNGAETIRTCVESVRTQTYGDLEYIIVDVGSSDDFQYRSILERSSLFT